MVSLIRCDQNTLPLEELRKLTILMHRHQDIASSNKFFVQIQLWDGRPIRVLLDTCKYR